VIVKIISLYGFLNDTICLDDIAKLGQCKSLCKSLFTFVKIDHERFLENRTLEV